MSKMSKRDAEILWAAIRAALTNTEAAILAVIASEAWKPLGFGTFAEAWDARMRGVSLSNTVKAHVIYVMLTEPVSMETIASLTNVDLAKVQHLAEQQRFGIPPEAATVVHQHLRKSPGKRLAIRVVYTESEMLYAREVARRSGKDLREVSKTATLAALRDLEMTLR
jgi:hypothetical protein